LKEVVLPIRILSKLAVECIFLLFIINSPEGDVSSLFREILFDFSLFSTFLFFADFIFDFLLLDIIF